MQTVETRLRSEMDAIFDFLGSPRTSVQHIVPPSTDIACEKIERENQENVDKNGNLPFFNNDGAAQEDERAKTSPPRPQKLNMSDPRPKIAKPDPEVEGQKPDPRQKLLKSQQLIEKHINKLLKELEDKNGQSSHWNDSSSLPRLLQPPPVCYTFARDSFVDIVLIVYSFIDVLIFRDLCLTSEHIAALSGRKWKFYSAVSEFERNSNITILHITSRIYSHIAYRLAPDTPHCINRNHRMRYFSGNTYNAFFTHRHKAPRGLSNHVVAVLFVNQKW